MFMKNTLIVFFLLISTISCKQPKDLGLKTSSTMMIGTAAGHESIYNDTLYRQTLVKEFNSITATNIMKMKHVFIAEDSLHWGKIDSFINFSVENNLRIHGHTLVWHQSTPEWITSIKDSARLEELVKNYITTYVSRYRGKVRSWDVINEAISDSGGIIRPSVWSNELGDDFLARMFQYAHAADPNVLLFYNDYLIEEDSVKLATLLKWIDSWQQRGIPIHGIGFQMHCVADTPSVEVFKRAFSEIVKRGLQVHISELDVRVNRYNVPEKYFQWNDNLAQLQAKRYAEIINAYKSAVPENLRYGITFWDYTDKYSWIPRFYKTFDWPCIYDSLLKRKPAYDAVLDAISIER